MPSQTPPGNFLEIGSLPFIEGGYLLVKSALAKVGLHTKLKIHFSARFFAEHLESYCRAHHIVFSRTDAEHCEISNEVASPAYTVAGESSAQVADEASPAWGLAARGASVEPGISGFFFPLNQKKIVWTDKARRYYRLAAARQWNPEVLDWQTPVENPEPVEDAIVQVMTYLIENETAALIIPSRFIGQIHPHFREVAQFLAIQAADEARHIEVFSRRAALKRTRLGVSALSGQSSLRTLIQETDFSLSALLLSVLGEGTFLTLLIYLGRYAPDALTRRICRYAARDESRHVAFALAHLMQHRDDPEMLGRYRNAIRRRYESLSGFSELNAEVYAALHLVFAGSLEAGALREGYARMSRMVAEMHRSRTARLMQLGFATAEATQLSSLHTKNFM